MKIADDFGVWIAAGDVGRVRAALEDDSSLASRAIAWHLNQDNLSDPLHFVSDAVGHGWLRNGTEAEIAGLLLAHGAAVEGSDGRESPLLAAVSLGAERVARRLLEAGADCERTSVFGARAIHWAAWLGLPASVAMLVGCGAEIEARCSEFGATPLYWAVHGYGPQGPRNKSGQVAAAGILLEAGADSTTTSRSGQSALALAALAADDAMARLLRTASGGG